MPSPKSRGCWNPAVPPPPVAGATAGNGLGVTEGLGVGLAEGLGVGMTVGLADGVTVALAEGLAVALAEGVTVALADEVTVGLAVPGDNGGGAAEVPDPEQAETAAETNMVKAA